MKKIFILIAVVFLSACDGSSYYFSSDKGDAQKMAKDQFDCLITIASNNNPNIPADMLEKLCMQSKGYDVHKGNPPQEEDDNAAPIKNLKK